MSALSRELAKTFNNIADAIEKGSFSAGKKIGLTTLGSEHGSEALIEGALLAKKLYPLIDIVLIGEPNDSGIETVETTCEADMYAVMERMLDSGELGACVTMHYNFPIGVSTVGRVITPARGKEMIIATTTGTSSAHRVEAMVKNAIYGIITAKSIGIPEPKVGILNVDGARTVEKILKDIREAGYEIHFSESRRSDGGTVMRGNDLLTGAADVMVTDTLTGNILMKLFSAFQSGGEYEVTGYGYGPGVGEKFNRNILILSRASGAPVIANAIKYAFDISKGNINDVADAEFAKLDKVKWKDIIAKQTAQKESKPSEADVVAPPKEAVTEQISGIDIMDLEDAVRLLWKNGIYAESGMGCTGPIVLVAPANFEKSIDIIIKGGFAAAQ